MPVIRSLLFALCAAAVLLPVTAGAHDIDNPVIGSWTWQPEGKSCTEVYDWRADGSGHVTSGKEVTESKFQVSNTPDEHGFYVFIEQIIKDNRGKDCTGSSKDDSGRKATFYIQVHPSGNMIRICARPSEDSCFGPLQRIPVVEI